MNWESLKQVYDDHHEQVLHVAFDILQDYGLAEDICAEVFVEFYRDGKSGRVARKRMAVGESAEESCPLLEKVLQKKGTGIGR